MIFKEDFMYTRMYVCILEGERACAQVGGAEGEEERESQSDCLLSMEPHHGAQSHHPEIMT